MLWHKQCHVIDLFIWIYSSLNTGLFIILKFCVRIVTNKSEFGCSVSGMRFPFLLTGCSFYPALQHYRRDIGNSMGPLNLHGYLYSQQCYCLPCLQRHCYCQGFNSYNKPYHVRIGTGIPSNVAGLQLCSPRWQHEWMIRHPAARVPTYHPALLVPKANTIGCLHAVHQMPTIESYLIKTDILSDLSTYTIVLTYTAHKRF